MTLLQAGRNLLARGGVPELYQGLGVTLIGSMPSVGVYFGLYQYAKRQMDAKDGMSPYVSIAVSAGLGNFVARYECMYHVSIVQPTVSRWSNAALVSQRSCVLLLTWWFLDALHLLGIGVRVRTPGVCVAFVKYLAFCLCFGSQRRRSDGT